MNSAIEKIPCRSVPVQLTDLFLVKQSIVLFEFSV